MYIIKSEILVFIFLILIATLNQVFQIIGTKITFLYSYLDDLLFFPLMLTLILLIKQNFNSKYIMSKKLLFSFFVFFSTLTEFIYPNIFSRCTYDPFDILCYAIGSIWFYLYFNKKCLIQNLH